jgi:hypothetical protein
LALYISTVIEGADLWGDEVAGGLRKLHNEELHDLYSSPDEYVGMIKSKEMR